MQHIKALSNMAVVGYQVHIGYQGNLLTNLKTLPGVKSLVCLYCAVYLTATRLVSVVWEKKNLLAGTFKDKWEPCISHVGLPGAKHTTRNSAAGNTQQPEIRLALRLGLGW